MPKKPRGAAKQAVNKPVPPKPRRIPKPARRAPRSAPLGELRQRIEGHHTLVVVRDRDGTVVRLPALAPYQATVERWSYVLQSRRSWANRFWRTAGTSAITSTASKKASTGALSAASPCSACR